MHECTAVSALGTADNDNYNVHLGTKVCSKVSWQITMQFDVGVAVVILMGRRGDDVRRSG